MTTHDEQSENNSSEPIEPTIESISPARGTYAALNSSEHGLGLFDKFLDPERNPMPDIDRNFVDSDRKRTRAKNKLKEKYGNPESTVLDGYSDKEELIRKAREAEDNTRIRNAEWYTTSIRTSHFFR